MKILYALQATGNGHISRANELVPEFRKHATVDVLISGTRSELKLQHAPRYRLRGFSLASDKNGGVSYLKTLGLFNPLRFIREMRSIDLDAYDLVVNDFEPVSAWACRMRRKTCIALSHQFALTRPGVPMPENLPGLFRLILGYYAPCLTGIGFHFNNYGSGILTPVIREAIRSRTPCLKDHFTVYLPAYSDQFIIDFLSTIARERWQIFSRSATSIVQKGNCTLLPVNADSFTESLLACKGILCGAGFETPAEALYLGKKLMVIPMKGQYEQYCNAAALARMGHPVIPRLENKYLLEIIQWSSRPPEPPLAYPCHHRQIWDELSRLRQERCETGRTEKKTTAQDYAVVQV